MTNEVELHVDGEEVTIEIEELTPLERMAWAGKAPNLQNGNVDMGEMVPFLIALTESQTILTRGLLNDIPQEELSRLFREVVNTSFDIDSTGEDEEIDISDGDIRGFQ